MGSLPGQISFGHIGTRLQEQFYARGAPADDSEHQRGVAKLDVRNCEAHSQVLVRSVGAGLQQHSH
eukprot:m.282994 g.282994  ORF g.282994 m.282994 type:complete len:66 (-) comp54940_c1_seq1:461-658(-)